MNKWSPLGCSSLRPVYHQNFIRSVTTVLKLLCGNCSRLTLVPVGASTGGKQSLGIKTYYALWAYCGYMPTKFQDTQCFSVSGAVDEKLAKSFSIFGLSIGATTSHWGAGEKVPLQDQKLLRVSSGSVCPASFTWPSVLVSQERVTKNVWGKKNWRKHEQHLYDRYAGGGNNKCKCFSLKPSPYRRTTV